MINFKNFIVIIIFFKGFFLFAQEENLYTWFDQKVGLENSSLYNGIEFIDVYKLEDNEHRFFEIDSFVVGSIKYENQNYKNVFLKYDLYEDQLIVKIENKNEGANQILLFNEKIERFTIDDSQFEKINNLDTTEEIPSGFFQLLANNNHIQLYRINHKKLKKVIKNNFVYYKFIEVKPEYFILTKGEFFKIKKKRDLISMYPEHKKELSDFKWNTKNFENNDKQLILAVNKLGNILEE
jgi:hypothetical protein